MAAGYDRRFRRIRLLVMLLAVLKLSADCLFWIVQQGDAASRAGRDEVMGALRAQSRIVGDGQGSIAVIIPCFKQAEFIVETIDSVVAQSFPPLCIIVVDDSSPDGCADVAMRHLRKDVAARRSSQRRALQSWLNLSLDVMESCTDDVLTTAGESRGVAAARNRALRQATTTWVCCLDGDDVIDASYFEEAMRAVAKDATINLVYANQEFFGESHWRWDVPEWSPQAAVAAGPLPVMTVMRRSLWASTPHGFDEVLPMGHEDWSLWLQYARLPVRAHKIPKFLLKYRFRGASKKRQREAHHPEVPRLLRTLFPDLYPIRTLLDDHAALAAGGLTDGVLASVRASLDRHADRSVVHLWLGMHAEHRGEYEHALREHSAAEKLREGHDWQPIFRRACCGAKLEDVDQASDPCSALRAAWGTERFAWYLASSSEVQACCPLLTASR